MLSSSLFEECKYVAKERKIPKYFIDDTETSDSGEENPDEMVLKKNYMKKNSDEKNPDEENSREENSSEENQSFSTHTKSGKDCRKKHVKDTKIFLT